MYADQLTKEQSFALLLSRANLRPEDEEQLRALASQPLNWPEVIGYVVFHRVVGIALPAMLRLQLYANREVMTPFTLLYQAQVERNKVHRDAVLELSTALEQGGLSFVFLKGSALSHTVYQPGVRISNDVDILVNSDHLDQVTGVLAQLGYRQARYDAQTHTLVDVSRREKVFARTQYSELIPFCRLTDNPFLACVDVDVNFTLTWAQQSPASDRMVRQFLLESTAMAMEGASIPTLQWEAFLVQLCVHLYKEAVIVEWGNDLRDLNLYKFVDIHALATWPDSRIVWDSVVAMAREQELVEAVYYALFFTEQLYPGSIPPQVLEALMPASTAYLEEYWDGASEATRRAWAIPFPRRVFDVARISEIAK